MNLHHTWNYIFKDRGFHEKTKQWARQCDTCVYDEDNNNKNNDDDDVVDDDDDNAKKAVTYSHIEHTSEQFKDILHK